MLAFASAAPALTLQDLDAGAVFASGDGTLTFSFAPGSISLNGSLDPDLSLYPVTPLPDGFEISGPLAVFAGAFGGITMGYQVAPALGLALDGADLLIAGLATGIGALASAGTTLGNGIALGTVLTGFGLNQATDSAGFAPEGPLQGVTAIQLMALGAGELSLLQTLRQRFSVQGVAEPSATLLLAAGLSGLAFLGRGRPGRPRVAARPEASAAG
jgi:hypothetical protein